MITWTYNDANRQVTRTATGAEGPYSETTTSDAFGRIASMLNALGTFTWNYTGTDPRPGSITHSGGFDTEFTYDPLTSGGNLATLTSKLPGGATIAKHSYTRDTLGQIATWKREAPLANPGTTHQYQWTLAHDFSGQLTSVIEKDLTGGLRASHAFAYDAASNRTSAFSAQTGTTAKAMTAAHNSMNQITSLGGGGKTRVAGSLDEPGQVSVGLAGQGDKPARMLSGNRFETELDLPSGTSTLQITAADGSANLTTKQYSVVTSPETSRSVSHDADGNLTSDGVRSYEWDTWSRLKKITWASGKTTTFHYNALGERTKMVHVDAGVTRTEYFLYDGPRLIQRRSEGTATSNIDGEYFSGGERRWNTGTGAWVNHHYCRDHLGSVREVLDSSGNLLARYDYAPYGERQIRYEAAGYSSDVGFTGHFHLPSPVSGQSEILLAHFRAYDPVLGRWLSQDPIREIGGINLYGYVGGHVAGALDLWGLEWHHLVPFTAGLRAGLPENFINSPANGWDLDTPDHKRLHASGWLSEWNKFFEKHPNCTPEQASAHLEKMRADPKFSAILEKGKPVGGVYPHAARRVAIFRKNEAKFRGGSKGGAILMGVGIVIAGLQAEGAASQYMEAVDTGDYMSMIEAADTLSTLAGPNKTVTYVELIKAAENQGCRQ